MRKDNKGERVYRFVSTSDAIECDVCIVFITAKEAFQNQWQFKCAPQNIIAICSESQFYEPIHSAKYLNQFGLLWTNQTIALKRHKNVMFEKIPNNPFVISTHGLENGTVPNAIRDYDFFKSNIRLEKTKEISIIASNQTSLKGHKDRLAFARAIKQHFGERIDFFGRGINPVADKFEAVANYKYHIAIENASCEHYVTEKLEDSYLCLTYPFYFGAPNVSQYFPKDSFTGIDIYDIERSIRIIEETIKKNAYEKSISTLALCKDLVLNKYNFFRQIIGLCEDRLDLDAEKTIVTISPRPAKPNWRIAKVVNQFYNLTQQRGNIKDFVDQNV